MPNARVTNISSDPLLLRTIYGAIAPGAYVDVFRSPADLTDWRDLHEAIAAGKATLVITPTAAEIGSDFVPYPGLATGVVPPTRTLSAGAGLTGGGDLTANRTFNVVANADGSIVVNADDIQVGVLASDTQHGVRGGGTQHAAVIAGGANGFMTGADKTKIDGIASGATNTPLSTATPQDVGTAAPGSGTAASKDDHVHGHGNQAGGSLHSLAIAGGNAGFLSGSDKTKLDGLPASAVPTARTLTAGNGLTGGGDLSADRSFAVTAADLSIAVGAGGVSVGVLQNDTQHGSRGGGSQHSLVIAGGAAGFMSGTDKSKLDGIAVGSGGSLAPIDTLANLALLVATSYPDGTKIYVNEVEDTYVLEKASAHTPDGLCVIAAVGGGYWVARNAGRWEDVQGSIGQGAGAALLTVEPYRDTAFLMWYMRHDQNDALNFVYQFPHRWKYDTAVVPHLHVLPAADPLVAQVARFDGYYAWSRVNNAAIPALVGWTPFGPIDVTINPGDVYIQKIVSLGTWTPPAYARGSTCLLIWFRRAGTDPGDTYTTNRTYGPTTAANLGILSTDVHYRLANQGSEQEIPP